MRAPVEPISVMRRNSSNTTDVPPGGLSVSPVPERGVEHHAALLYFKEISDFVLRLQEGMGIHGLNRRTQVCLRCQISSFHGQIPILDCRINTGLKITRHNSQFIMHR